MMTLQMLLMLVALDQVDASEASLAAMSKRAASTRLSLVASPTKSPQLVPTPVFRYSDELRRIQDATVWVWTHEGHPVSVIKVEHYEPGRLAREWLYCFSSLSTELVVAEWDPAPTFRARQPGVIWKSLPDKPANSRTARLIQMRDMARRFAPELTQTPGKEDRYQMRLLSRPLYRYEETMSGQQDGALFGFTGTGTNPDLLLVLDLTEADGWRFSFTRMTTEGLTVRLDGETVWDVPHVSGAGRVFDTWTYFHPND